MDGRDGKIKLIMGVGLLVISPLIAYQANIFEYIILGILTLAWIGYWFIKNIWIKNGLIIILVFMTTGTIAFRSEYIERNGRIDNLRTFAGDKMFNEKIEYFATNSVYLPYGLRSIVWNKSILIVNTLGRTVQWLGVDMLMAILGPGLMVAFILGVIEKGKRLEKFVIGLGVMVGVISRNPNSGMFYFLLLPAILAVSINGVNKLKLSLLTGLLLFGFLMRLSL